jgi:hypothetical protein
VESAKVDMETKSATVVVRGVEADTLVKAVAGAGDKYTATVRP